MAPAQRPLTVMRKYLRNNPKGQLPLHLMVRCTAYHRALLIAAILLNLSATVSAAQNDDPSPQDLYRTAWRTVQQLYYDRTFNGQNWTKWQHHFDGKLCTTKDAHYAIQTMLASLGNDNARLIIAGTRDKTKDKGKKAAPAEIQVLTGNVGYIRVGDLMLEQSKAKFSTALQKLSATKGIIIDLRDNVGGLLANAIEIADMFLDRGTILSIVDPDGRKIVTASGATATHQPVTVLVNESTADGAEILAAALQENGRAKLVGATTFGARPVLKTLARLNDGSAIMFATASWLTPSGHSILHLGLKPDVQVLLNKQDGADHQGPWWTAGKTFTATDSSRDRQLKAATQVFSQ